MADALKTTPFHALHLAAGAKMVPFAGYDMPVQYPLGIKKEHLHTRQQAGLFDVSHMGQIRITGETAAQELEKLVPVDIVDLPEMKQRYALFTNQQGGVLDDLMVTNAGDHLFLVVNAACKHQDFEHLQQHLSEKCQLEMLEDRALIAIQGPKARQVMTELCAEAANMTFMTAANLSVNGIECFVTCSGYTGEDGYEISVAAEQAEALAQSLLEQPSVEWIGLGARDSLRLEAGLCLYGHELSPTISPIESSLNWAISKVRRSGETRQGGFFGAETILAQMAEGTTRKRVGLKPLGKMPVREGVELFDEDENPIGEVTSGGYGASFGGPITMGLVQTEFAEVGTRLVAMVRNKPVEMEVVKLPFVTQNYYRG